MTLPAQLSKVVRIDGFSNEKCDFQSRFNRLQISIYFLSISYGFVHVIDVSLHIYLADIAMSFLRKFTSFFAESPNPNQNSLSKRNVTSSTFFMQLFMNSLIPNVFRV